MELFFDDNFGESQPVLNSNESKHCIQVLRHKAGDVIKIINGKGTLFSAAVIDANPKRCTLGNIESTFYPINKSLLHIAIAPTKNNDRLEWFTEKATEIGITAITPILCHHSERRHFKTDRLQKIVISAIKQSHQYHKPLINDLIAFEKFIAVPFEGSKYIAHCINYIPKINLANVCKNELNCLILIGPEGDFSEKEVQLALNNGFISVSLGESRLRTETAGVVACHTVRLMQEI